MFDNNVRTGNAVWIDEKDEIIITKTIAEIVNKGINPLVRPDGDDSRKGGEKAISLWTQRFGKSGIKDENYLNNAIEYIRNNRKSTNYPKIKK